MNVYRFHVVLVNSADRRIRKETNICQEGTNLNAAWDVAERKIRADNPGHDVSMSIGHRARKLKSPKVRRAA